jgi:hypothetical protein
MDSNDIAKQQLKQKLAEVGQAKLQQWVECERLLVANQSLLEDGQQRSNSLSLELENASPKTREKGISKVGKEAKVKANFLAKR